jgi:hypothetical protein
LIRKSDRATAYNAMLGVARELYPNLSPDRAFVKAYAGPEADFPGVLSEHLSAQVAPDDTKVRRPNFIGSLHGGNMRKPPAPSTDDDYAGSLDAWNAGVAQIARQKGIGVDRATMEAMKSPNLREHFDRARAHEKRKSGIAA